MIELGGNIKLIQFEEIEPGLLIVIKKIVGNYTKRFSENLPEFKSIEVTLEDVIANRIKVKVEYSDVKESTAEDKNLFFALDKALSSILKQ